LLAGWRFWVDRGGTFTDLVALPPHGPLVVRKVLSVQPEVLGDPAVAAIRELLALEVDAPLPPGLIQELRLGTTVATNALLERSGAPPLLLVNRGFADALLIGDQHRADLFALQPIRPAPLYQQVLEVEGRLGADGIEVEPLRLDDALAASVRAARRAGCRSCAVVLLHATRQPLHEIRLGEWLQSFGFEQVVLSHQVSPSPRFVPRGHTALVEAFVGPPLGAYLDQVAANLGASSPLRVMQSNGGLIHPAQLLAKDTILSGPAGGWWEPWARRPPPAWGARRWWALTWAVPPPMSFTWPPAAAAKCSSRSDASGRKWPAFHCWRPWSPSIRWPPAADR